MSSKKKEQTKAKSEAPKVIKAPTSSSEIEKKVIVGRVEKPKPSNNSKSANPPSKSTDKAAPTKTKKPVVDEIDDIFATAVKKDAPKQHQSSTKTSKPSANPKKGDDDFWADSRGKNSQRKYTDDGLPVYTAEELGITTEGGDTPLCPFDCECCH